MVEDFNENYITGWIKVYRSITKHWLWTNGKPLTKLEAWLLILIETNHNGDKVLIKGTLHKCDRGQKLYSIGTWAKKFNWSVQNVKTFFKLLENDKMITTKGIGNTTRLIVCNYDTYQDIQRASKEHLTSTQLAPNEQLTTIKELKNDNNEKNDKKVLKRKENFIKKSLEFKEKYSAGIITEFTDYWTELNKSKTKMKFELRETFEISKRLAYWNSRNIGKEIIEEVPTKHDKNLLG